VGCVPGKQNRRRTDPVTHHFAKCSRHHGRRMSNRIARVIEELYVDILTAALKRNENMSEVVTVGRRKTGGNSFKIAHADNPSIRGEGDATRCGKPDADPRETARSEAYRNESQRRRRQPRPTHYRVDDRQQCLGLPVPGLNALGAQDGFTDSYYRRARQAG